MYVWRILLGSCIASLLSTATACILSLSLSALSVLVLSLIRTYFLEADVGESHSSEGWAHFPPHDGAVAHVALEGGGGRRQRRRHHEEGGGQGARVESHRGRRVGRGPLSVLMDGVVRAVLLILT